MATVVSVGGDGSQEQHEMEPLANEDDQEEDAGTEEKQPEIPVVPPAGSRRSLEVMTLHQAARNGDADNMKQLLENLQGNVRKKINAKDDEGLSALHYAARFNHIKVVQMLVEYQADVNDLDEDGATPLHYAARYKRIRLGHIGTDTGGSQAHTPDQAMPLSPSVQSFEEPTPENSVILYLAHKGAKINARDQYGCTPLHLAAMRGNEMATHELMSCTGLKIEEQDVQKMTPLHLAASFNEVEICRMLLDKGANIRCRDETAFTPLHYACSEGNVTIARMLFDAAESWVTVREMLADQDVTDSTALHLAVENGSFEVAKLLIDKGANVNVARNNYTTPLHLAAVTGELSIVKLLVENNARVDALDINQSTALHRAAAFNHSEIVEYLLSKSAAIERTDKDNFTPLLIAASQGHGPTISTLLKKGANILAVDKNTKTALFWTAEEDQLEALQELLSHPASKALLDAADRYDNTPLHIAAEKGYVRIVRALLNAGADIDAKNEEEQTPLHLAARHGKTGVVREIVARFKMSINDEDEDSNTPLHLAALAGHKKVLALLVDKGADIEARNCNLWTPLDCAAAKGWEKCCKILLENDAPVDPMDKTKTTPLHLACQKGHVSVVQLLLDWDASVTQTDSYQNNCLDMAIDNGHKDVAMAIVSSDRWEEALQNQSDDINTGIRNTPMRKLIRKMPDVAEKVFNRCTEANIRHQDSEDYKITFNFEYLDDAYSHWGNQDNTSDSRSVSSVGSIYDEDNHLLPQAMAYTSDSGILKKNHPLYIMVQADQEDLLAHPLVTMLLNHKWKSFGRYIYYINLFVYCVFVFFLTAYIYTTAAPFMYLGNEQINNATRNGYNGSFCGHIRDVAPEPIKQHPVALIGKYFIMVLAAINILRELFQMLNSKLNYLGWENFIEWVTYVTALLLVIDFSECQAETGIRFDWQWQVGAVAIFLAWIDLVLFLQKLPNFGIYVIMFTDILSTFIQFFPVFFLFIVSFALAFFCLLQNQYEFRTIWLTLVKTSVMMIGEFEYVDIFHGLEDIPDTNSLEAHGKKAYYDIITYLIFVLFMILMSIIIMNLLVGLAVDDIKAVQEQAVLKRLAMQVELALDVEMIVPQFVRRRFITRRKTISPNKYVRGWKSWYYRCCGGEDTMSTSAISKALDPELDDMERLEENQEKLLHQVANMRRHMKDMRAQNEKLESMLNALLAAQGVDWQEEDATLEDDGTGL